VWKLTECMLCVVGSVEVPWSFMLKVLDIVKHEVKPTKVKPTKVKPTKVKPTKVKPTFRQRNMTRMYFLSLSETKISSRFAACALAVERAGFDPLPSGSGAKTIASFPHDPGGDKGWVLAELLQLMLVTYKTTLALS